MKTRLLVLLICCVTNSLFAHEELQQPKAEVSGIGQIKVRADYIHLTFNVRSECYANPSEAQDAADEVVRKIYKYLETLKTPGDKYFKILSSGGFTGSYNRWVHNKEICRNTFQKNTEITLNIGLSKDFSAQFTRIQEGTLNFFHQDPSMETMDKAHTFVTLGTPEPRVARINRQRHEREARSLALVDAQANYKAMVKTCAKQAFKIVNIKEAQSYNFPQPLNRSYQQSAPAAGQMQIAEVTPVRFDDVLITKELMVTFQVDGALCFEKP